MKNKIINRICLIVLVLIFVSMFIRDLNGQVSSDNLVLTQNITSIFNSQSNQTTYVFTSQNSALKIGKNDYFNVLSSSNETRAYIKTDGDGNLIEGDLTASKETSWTFENQTLNVQSGTRIIYKNGEFQIFNKNITSLKIKDKNLNISEQLQITQNESVFIKNGNNIKGKNFQIGNLKVNGQVLIVPEGYLLSKGSIGNWQSVEMTANKNELLIVKPGIDLKKVQGKNYISTDKILEANGEGFILEFKSGNPWININEKNKLKLDFESNIQLNIENRNSKNMAPLVSLTRNNNSLLKINDGKMLLEYGSKPQTAQNNLIFKKLLNPNKLEDDTTTPLELKDSENINESWYLDKSGNIIDSTYRVSNISFLSPEEFANLNAEDKKKYPPICSPAHYAKYCYEGGAPMEAKVLMDKEGNIKYPIYKSYAETTNFQNIGQFTELIKSDPEGYYLDDASLEHLKRTFVIGFGPDTADNDYWRKLMEMYPNDPRVKQIAIDKIISIQKEGKEVYYGENLPAGWISFGGPEKDSIPLALTLFKNYPDLQKSYLESITLTIKDKEYDANLLLHSAKASSNGVVFKTLLDKYGPKLKEEDYLNWQATYQIYHGFSSYFPDYNEIGLTDIQKLQFVKEEVFKSGYGSNPIVALPIKEIQQSINNYVGGDHKNKVLFDSSYDLYSYNYPTNNAGGSSSNFAVLPATLNQKNTFNKEVIRDVDKDGFSLTSRIKQDLADPNPDAKKIYVFNNHGGPNTQYVGMKFYLWSIELSDSDIADSLLKGYMASSKNPNKRTFGNKVMVFESCYSGDFIENTNNKLQDLLAKKGVNPNNVKLPTFISVTDKGKVGFTGSDGKNSIMLRLANQMNEENKNITLQRFLEERNKLFNEQYYNNPQILTSYN